MNRISQQYLEAVVRRINVATGSPVEPWTKGEEGKHYRANIGCYHLSGAYGGVSLHRMVSDGGGVSDVFRCGHIPKRELADRMHAFLDGIDTAKEMSAQVSA